MLALFLSDDKIKFSMKKYISKPDDIVLVEALMRTSVGKIICENYMSLI